MNEDQHRFRGVTLQELLDTPVSFGELRFQDLDLGIEPMDRPLDNWYEQPVGATVGDNRKRSTDGSSGSTELQLQLGYLIAER